MTTEYDPDTCIDVGTLRRAGVTNIPDHVPDCAWVHRDDIRTSVAVDRDKLGPELTAVVTLSFTAPFQWVEADVIIEPTR